MEQETSTLDIHQATDEATTKATGTVTDTALVADELLVEEISIDGMCGVY